MKAATPTLLGLLGVLLLALPLRLFYGGVPTPILPLVVVFFWSVYAPDFLPSPSIFAIGLLQDFLTGGPLGLWPAVYLFTQYIVLSQRSYFLGREQRVVWLGFAFAAAAASVILWLAMSLLSGVLLPIRGLAFQMATTALVYPVFSGAFSHLHRRVLVES
ncbi:rod shape-determining protein MreD [Amphiplicatus metriothermophilus]|uniref:Rod shape-determining protein MreD n=2 Tax=Amphiplicatus metriothermophilus TaxID=1519374 RepID=A0A239PQP0_9PROT|nr:rod shape-determining protein MreD [Amphiplicatus metriothermophilus]